MTLNQKILAALGLEDQIVKNIKIEISPYEIRVVAEIKPSLGSLEGVTAILSDREFKEVERTT